MRRHVAASAIALVTSLTTVLAFAAPALAGVPDGIYRGETVGQTRLHPVPVRLKVANGKVAFSLRCFHSLHTHGGNPIDHRSFTVDGQLDGLQFSATDVSRSGIWTGSVQTPACYVGTATYSAS